MAILVLPPLPAVGVIWMKVGRSAAVGIGTKTVVVGVDSMGHAKAGGNGRGGEAGRAEGIRGEGFGDAPRGMATAAAVTDGERRNLFTLES